MLSETSTPVTASHSAANATTMRPTPQPKSKGGARIESAVQFAARYRKHMINVPASAGEEFGYRLLVQLTMIFRRGKNSVIRIVVSVPLPIAIRSLCHYPHHHSNVGREPLDPRSLVRGAQSGSTNVQHGTDRVTRALRETRRLRRIYVGDVLFDLQPRRPLAKIDEPEAFYLEEAHGTSASVPFPYAPRRARGMT